MISMSSTEDVYHVNKFSEKIKYFLIVHYFVVIMSTFPYCPYMFSVVIISEYSGQITKTKTSSDKKRSVLMFLCWTVVSSMFLFCSFFFVLFFI